MPFIIKKGLVYGGSGGGVQYTEQALTEEQQTQARTNIGAASKNEVSILSEEMACKWVLISNGETKTKIDGSSYEVPQVIKCVIPNAGGEITFEEKNSFSLQSKNFPWQSGGLRKEIYQVEENTVITVSANISVYILDDKGYSYLKKDINKLSEDLSNLGGFTPIIDNTGKITGYKTSIGGADTVFPFKSGEISVASLIIGRFANGDSVSTHASTNNTEIFTATSAESASTGSITVNKNCTVKLFTIAAQRGASASATVKLNGTTIVSGSAYTNGYKQDIDLVSGDKLTVTVSKPDTTYASFGFYIVCI